VKQVIVIIITYEASNTNHEKCYNVWSLEFDYISHDCLGEYIVIVHVKKEYIYCDENAEFFFFFFMRQYENEGE